MKTIYRYFCRDPQLSNINPAPESTCPPSPWKPPAVWDNIQHIQNIHQPGPGCTRMAEHCIIHYWRYCGSPVTEDTLVQHQGTSGKGGMESLVCFHQNKSRRRCSAKDSKMRNFKGLWQIFLMKCFQSTTTLRKYFLLIFLTHIPLNKVNPDPKNTDMPIFPLLN